MRKKERKEGREGRRMGEGRRGERERSLERSDINSGVISCYITLGAQLGTL